MTVRKQFTTKEAHRSTARLIGAPNQREINQRLKTLLHKKCDENIDPLDVKCSKHVQKQQFS